MSSLAGRPACDLRHVSPPSVERQSADSGPPEMYPYVRRYRCHVVASRTSGLRGSIAMSLAPAHVPPSSTFFHVLPPSVVLYRPRSPPFRDSGPWAATQTTSEFFGWITIFPMCSDSLRPTLVHVRPASTDLYTPSP